MIKKILLTSLSLGIAYISLTSKVSGPANALSANLTKTSCGGSGCHAAGSPSITTGIAITPEGSGLPISNGRYTPNTTYTVVLTGFNTSSSTLSKFGFQIAATKSDGTQAGTLSAAPTGTAIRTVSGISILEHSLALNQGTLPGSYSVTFKWKAPAAGAGAISFNYVVMGVNADNTKDFDIPSPSRATVFNETPASINENINNIASTVYPNPCSNVLNIETASSTQFMATVYDIAGRQVIAPSQQNSIDVSALTNGLYMLRLQSEEGQQTVNFIKQ